MTVRGETFQETSGPYHGIVGEIYNRNEIFDPHFSKQYTNKNQALKLNFGLNIKYSPRNL